LRIGKVHVSGRAILAQAGKTGNGRDFWLKPEHTSPLPLKRRGVRRAKARFCQQDKPSLEQIEVKQASFVAQIEKEYWEQETEVRETHSKAIADINGEEVTA
jgi:hypothetical protein